MFLNTLLFHLRCLISVLKSPGELSLEKYRILKWKVSQ